MKTVLVTGAAGFIGSHTSVALVERGDRVVGLDNLNDYYSPERKRANVEEIRAETAGTPGMFTFVQGDIRDRDFLGRLFAKYQFDTIVHLAAMAGVRNSISDPHLYYDVNLFGTLNLLEATTGRLPGVPQPDGKSPHFVLASTSSVYGNTQRMPFVEDDVCDRPLAPYAASKRAAELLGYTYHHLYGQSFTALRFFTVYGSRGRPDMMAYKVADNIYREREVPLYNNGQMYRDWTYVSDTVSGIVAAVDHRLGYDIINLGRGEPVLLSDFIRLIESFTGRKAHLTPAPMPAADVPYTYASIEKAQKLLSYIPQVSVEEGVKRFLSWYEKAVLGESVLQ